MLRCILYVASAWRPRRQAITLSDFLRSSGMCFAGGASWAIGQIEKRSVLFDL